MGSAPFLGPAASWGYRLQTMGGIAHSMPVSRRQRIPWEPVAIADVLRVGLNQLVNIFGEELRPLAKSPSLWKVVHGVKVLYATRGHELQASEAMRAFSAGSSGWRKSVSSSRTFARVACITYLLRLSQCVLSSSKVVRLFSLEFRSQHPTLRPFGAKRRCLHSYHERHTRCHRRTGTQRKGVPSSPAQVLRV